MCRLKTCSVISALLFFFLVLWGQILCQSTGNSPGIDKSELLRLFQGKLFESLDSKLAGLQKAFENDYQAENQVFDAFETFKKADPAFDGLFKNWIEQLPDSYAPYTARAQYYFACALKARGNKHTVDKYSTEYKEMERFFSLALEDIDRALSINVLLDVCYAVKIDIGSALQNSELATTAYNEASKYHPYGFQVKLRYVQTMTPRKGGSYQKMDEFIRSCESLAVSNPKIKELNAAIPADKGSAFLFLGKNDQAVIMYTEALKFSNHHSYFADRGNAYTRARKFKLALEDYDKALELSPNNADYAQLKLDAAILQNRPDPAAGMSSRRQSDGFDDLKIASESEMKDASAHSQKGSQYLRSGQYDKAILEYSEAIRLNPNNDVYYYNRALCYMRTGNEDAAIQDFNRSIELGNDNISVYIRIATIYANRGMYDDALNAINKGIAVEPDNGEAYYCRGKVFERRGMNFEALEDMKKACALQYQRACREYKMD
ncbi:MAG: tetratricopeptide repeat protein [Bacteroidetes bacterium]|nr:tetratricopeptide repeat protein [Bacteroidota bacterium]